MDGADRIVIPLADIERLARIAPDMPALQVAEVMRWIAEMQPAQVCSEAPIPFFIAKVAPETDAPVAEDPPAPPPPAGPLQEDREMRKAAATPRKPGVSREWSHAEIRTALDMHSLGRSAAVIAARLGRPVQGTAFMLRKLKSGWRPAGWADKPANTPTPQPAAPVQPAPAAPPVAPVPSVALVPMSSQARPMTGAQRDLMVRIMRLGDDFTPQDDFYLVEEILGRTPLDVIADHLGCDIAAVKNRWVALVGFDPTKRPGGLPLQLQSDLVAVLRVLAEGEAA